MKMRKRAGVFWGDVVLGLLCAVLALILIGMIFVTVYADRLLGKINYVPEGAASTYSDEEMETMDTIDTLPPDYTGVTYAPEDITVPTAPPVIQLKNENVINILLIGQDRRPGEGRRRSDSMIVCSINKKTNTITLTSFMRDMYVMIPGWKMTKMNAAYAKGGMPLLKQTLQYNFGVEVDGCIEVDFDGFRSIIDLVGGVDIELTQEEADHLNASYGFSLTEGMNHLNGAEALGYSRIRKIGSDYARTNRQRKVLKDIIANCRDMSLGQLTGLMEEALPMVTTDMTENQISRLAVELFPILAKSTVNSMRIPANGDYESTYLKGVGAVLIPDLEASRLLLKEKWLP